MLPALRIFPEAPVRGETACQPRLWLPPVVGGGCPAEPAHWPDAQASVPVHCQYGSDYRADQHPALLYGSFLPAASAHTVSQRR